MSSSVEIKKEPVSPPPEPADGSAEAAAPAVEPAAAQLIAEKDIKKEPASPEKKANGSSKSKSEDYDKLITYGLDEKVASRLDAIYQTGKLSHEDLDDRALDALKEFPSDGAVAVLAQFLESNLEHVSNKSAYLCGVMKTYRQKTRAQQHGKGMGGMEKLPPLCCTEGFPFLHFFPSWNGIALLQFNMALGARVCPRCRSFSFPSCSMQLRSNRTNNCICEARTCEAYRNLLIAAPAA